MFKILSFPLKMFKNYKEAVSRRVAISGDIFHYHDCREGTPGF